MARELKIPLERPIITHDGQVKEVVLKEPSFRDFIAIGEPILTGRSTSGEPFLIEDREAISAYLEKCVSSPDFILLGQASARDARKVKEALLSFFFDVSQASGDSPTSPMISPSS